MRIQPKEYISERFVQDYIDYSKKEAIKLYLQKFPQFARKELWIE
jgi:hypothetical protein